jgi:hypothetical protein
MELSMRLRGSETGEVGLAYKLAQASIRSSAVSKGTGD